MPTNVQRAEDIDLLDVRPFALGQDHAVLARLREDDPLHWNDEPGEEPGFWSLTRYADVRAALSDHQRLSSAQGTQIGSRTVEGSSNPSLHNTDPPRHGKLRRIAIPYLRAVKVEAWKATIRDAVDLLLEEALRRSEFNLVELISSRLPVLVLGRVLGIPDEDGPRMVDWTNRLIDPESVTDNAAMEQTRSEFAEYFGALTDARRREPRDDLVSVLAAGEMDGQPLPWEDLQAYLSLLVAAGNETTRNLISGGVMALHEHPDQWQRLRAEPRLLASATEEMLRWVTPLACQRRTATEAIEWHGRSIQAGDKVVLWFSSANRDPAMFDDPDRFVADRYVEQRNAPEHMSFGWGIHFCMGAHLARAEMVGLFGEILRRGLELHVLGEPQRLASNMFHGIKALPVRLQQAA